MRIWCCAPHRLHKLLKFSTLIARPTSLTQGASRDLRAGRGGGESP